MEVEHAVSGLANAQSLANIQSLANAQIDQFVLDSASVIPTLFLDDNAGQAQDVLVLALHSVGLDSEFCFDFQTFQYISFHKKTLF